LSAPEAEQEHNEHTFSARQMLPLVWCDPARNYASSIADAEYVEIVIDAN
jgi:hypothetical protein